MSWLAKFNGWIAARGATNHAKRLRMTGNDVPTYDFDECVIHWSRLWRLQHNEFEDQRKCGLAPPASKESLFDEMLYFAQQHFHEAAEIFPELSNRSIDDLWMILGVAIIFSGTHTSSDLTRAIRIREIKRQALISLESV